MARGLLNVDRLPVDDLASAIDAIWARSRGLMLSHVDRIDAAASSLVAASLTPAERMEAQRSAHRLAGTVGTFGFHAASALARDIELALDSSGLDDSSTILRIAEHAVALRAALDVNVQRTRTLPLDLESPSAATQRPESANVVAWMVGEDEDRFDAIAVAAVASGAAVFRRSETTLPAGDDTDAPDVLFLAPSADIALSDAGDSYADVIRQLTAWRSRHPQVVTIVLEPRGLELRAPCEVRTRVAISEADAFGPVPRHVDGDQLWRFVHERCAERVGNASHNRRTNTSASKRAVVLLVSDDPDTIRRVVASFAPLGHAIITLEDPLKLWEAIASHQPELLVLDLDTACIDALVLVRLLREDVRWHPLPMIVLTANAASARAVRSREVGADDVLSLSMPTEQLRRRVNRQLARATAVTDPASDPALLRIASRSQTLELMSREMHLATQSGMPLCAVLLRFESMPVAARPRHADMASPAMTSWLSRQLSRARRVGETASRMSLDTVLLTWRGVTRVEAEVRLRTLSRASLPSAGDAHEDARSTHTVSIGCIERTSAHADARELLRDTERALWQTPLRTPDVVAPLEHAAAGCGGPRRIGVALVEDDPALAELLELTLEAAGHHVCRWEDGDEVSAALCGPAPSILARVILLDINLPSVDGLTLLRRLGASGVLRQSRVIVMSVRANEDEVLQAFAAGAFDFVAKPLSVPVLLQRVRRALAA